MDYWEMLREVIGSSGKSLSEVSREIGKSRSFLSVAFHDRKKLRSDLLFRVFEVCGYRVTATGANTQYVIRPEWTRVPQWRAWSDPVPLDAYDDPLTRAEAGESDARFGTMHHDEIPGTNRIRHYSDDGFVDYETERVLVWVDDAPESE